MRAPAGTADVVIPLRFASADTTILRDTLDLHFDRLFVLADSLRATPDSLRALAIRFDIPLTRVVFLADSMRVPVDSVGPVLERERTNPLASTVEAANEFHYTSGYNLTNNTSTWTNGSDYNLVRGGLFVRNVTNISLAAYQSTTVDASQVQHTITTKRQQRASTTELGWRFSPSFSVGGRANLTGFANLDKTLYAQNESTNEFDLSMRSKTKPLSGLDTELNFFSGYLDQDLSGTAKRGLSGDLNGRALYARGGWLSHDLDGQVTGNLARSHLPTSLEEFNTRDVTGNLRGTLALFAQAPVGLNLNYTLRSGRVQRLSSNVPPDVQDILTQERTVDGTVRFRLDSDRYLNVEGKVSNTGTTTTLGLGSVTVGGQAALALDHIRSLTMDGRYSLAGFALDARFNNGYDTGETPKPTIIPSSNPLISPDTLIYRERQLLHTRSLDATLTRPITARLTARLSGTIGLDSYDYTVNVPQVEATLPRDQYRQSWRTEETYNYSDRFNTRAALEVQRNLLLNISSVNSSSSTESRIYRAEWQWTFRLLTGLTATQRNSLSSEYDFPIDQLAMDYSTVTTLNAVISPRLTLDVTHNARFSPRGSYLMRPDGVEVFAPATQARNYILSARFAYTPAPALSLYLSPEYDEYNNDSRQKGVVVPQTVQKQLNFGAGANLNFPVGKRGRLTGTLNRTYTDARSFAYGVGVPQPSQFPVTDYWNGSLQFSWQL